ncbi:hypothetical protein JAAARDRAFT_91563, partial [Jaapia argillacea MUCL 33604]
AKSQKTSTHAWANVNKAEVKVQRQVKRYNRARDSLETLGASLGTMARFQKIHHADLKMSGDIVEENWLGQRSDTLPWFWRLDRNLEGQADDILDE